MAATQTFVPGQLYEMPLNDLQPDPNQPRKYLDPVALEELTASIMQQKVLAPILFRVENSICYIVAGERRCIAARKAGLSTIPAIYTDSPNHDEIAVIENTVRMDFTPIEEAEALDRLIKLHGYTQEDLARIMGKDRTSISKTLSLNRLPEAIREACRKDPSIPKRVLIDIAGNKREPSMIKAFEKYLASVNPEKKPRKTSTMTKIESAVKVLETATKKLDTVDVNELQPEEKAGLSVALLTLKVKIEALLRPLLDQPV